MKRLTIPATLLLLAAFLDCAAQTVELNGIACFFGQKYALFGISVPGSPTASGFLLAPGESQSGIKLLAVDAVSGRVQIENHGEQQFLRLAAASGSCSMPPTAIASGGNFSATRGGKNSAVVPNADDLVQQYQIMAGNPGWGTLPPLKRAIKPAQTVAAAAGTTGGNVPAASGSATGNPAGTDSIGGSGHSAVGTEGGSNGNNNSAGGGQSAASAIVSSGSVPAVAGPDQSSQEWYVESMVIEQSRASTTQEVLAGEMAPWPRTPFTPPGTPANLVGREVFFSNHMPGNFVVPGFVNQ